MLRCVGRGCGAETRRSVGGWACSAGSGAGWGPALGTTVSLRDAAPAAEVLPRERRSWFRGIPAWTISRLKLKRFHSLLELLLSTHYVAPGGHVAMNRMQSLSCA